MFGLTSVQSKLVIAGCAVFVVVAGLTVWWVLTSPFTVVGSLGDDDMERSMSLSMIHNGRDFYMWYKSNIVIQVLSIICGISATVIAALTTATNAPVMKYVTITFTALTSLLVGLQSTFNIRENLANFIRVNTDLSNLQATYVEERSRLAPNDPVKKKEMETKYRKEFNKIAEIRWRAYGLIGQKPNETDKPPLPLPNNNPLTTTVVSTSADANPPPAAESTLPASAKPPPTAGSGSQPGK